jgi:hypothetical protein
MRCGWSLLDLYNDALLTVGQDLISDTDEATDPAKFCRHFWKTTRDSVLATHPWKCATKRVALVRLATAPVTKWAYAYQLPTDCLRVLRMNDYLDSVYAIEGDALVTDEQTASISYTSRVESVADFEPLLFQAMGAYLAHKIAFPLTKSRELMATCLEIFERKVDEAKGVDATQATPEAFVTDGWERSRE